MQHRQGRAGPRCGTTARGPAQTPWGVVAGPSSTSRSRPSFVVGELVEVRGGGVGVVALRQHLEARSGAVAAPQPSEGAKRDRSLQEAQAVVALCSFLDNFNYRASCWGGGRDQREGERVVAPPCASLLLFGHRSRRPLLRVRGSAGEGRPPQVRPRRPCPNPRRASTTNSRGAGRARCGPAAVGGSWLRRRRPGCRGPGGVRRPRSPLAHVTSRSKTGWTVLL